MAVLVMFPRPATDRSDDQGEDRVPAPRVATLQVIVPVPPTAGVVQDQPAAGANETNVVPAGTASEAKRVASLGPALFTVMV